MRPRIALLLLGLACSGISACATSTSCDVTADCVTTPPPNVGEEFELAPQGSVTVTGTLIRITLVRVTDDSRCPTDVVCVWAGSAAIDLVLSDNGAMKDARLNTNMTPKTATIGAYELSVVDVSPAPKSGTTIRPQDYRVRMKLVAK